MVAILVVLTIVIALAIDSVVLASSRKNAPAAASLPVESMHAPEIPQGVFLASSHTWARITGDGRLRVGLDDLLAGALGEVQAVKVAAHGTQVNRGDTLFTLTVNGRSLEVPSPVAGEVVSANDKALTDPRSITKDPYGAGWLASVWTRDHHAAIQPLRIGAAATSYLRQELARFADFLTPVGTLSAVPVMADGGLPAKGAAGKLDDATWKDFETKFVAATEPKA